MLFADKCQTECAIKVKEQIPLGCGKEKCILNLNFNFGQFLVSKIHYDFSRNSFEIEKQVISSFQKEIIATYNCKVWQPPETFSE
ncbi:hypothetical protein [Flavobacterium arsenatis]|nr:hypothetical protein [Flavobacterium arsenatis]